ncbi:hypothetical protein BVRB_3g064190 [Beta vulgaris subsp. vulgaris]|nr:hypothetical protein BVRB_3g064190 [Beta vulgaris subsp. vulgaris]
MAGITKACAAFLCMVILLVTYSPKTNALTILGQNVNLMAIVGTARCSPTVTGICLTRNCLPLPNLTLDATLNGNLIASATTTANGSFSINVSNLLSNVNDINSLTRSLLAVRVNTSVPITSCPILGTASGQLQAVPIIPAALNVVNGLVTVPLGPLLTLSV